MGHLDMADLFNMNLCYLTRQKMPIRESVRWKTKSIPQRKSGLHPRNRHRSRYDFDALSVSCPELIPFLAPNAYGDISVDFADPRR